MDGGGGGQLEAGYTLCWDTGSSVVSSLSDRNRYNPQGGCWQQFGITHILIKVIHCLHRPCSATLWFYRVDKTSLTANLAMHLWPYT